MKALYIILAVAAVILTLALVSCADESAAGTDDVSSDAETDAADNYEELGFIVENGVLIKYVGTDADVIIPDGIVKIANDAFADCDFVTSLSIGKDMAEIEDRALFPLTALKSITVPEENTAYIMNGDILEKKDGSLIMSVMNELYENKQYDYVIKSDGTMVITNVSADYCYKEEDFAIGYYGDGSFGLIVENFKNGIYPCSFEELSKIEIGDAVIDVEVEKNEDFDGEIYYVGYVNSASVFGHTVTFDEYEIFISGGDALSDFTAFVTDEVLVIGAPIYVITKSGVYTPAMTVKNTDEYNNWVCYHFYEKDGKLMYVRKPLKYDSIIQQVGGIVFEACVSKDELYREDGYVTIENGEFIYTSEKTITVEEHFDLEKEFEIWKEVIGLDPDMTMEELIEENSKKYIKIN